MVNVNVYMYTHVYEHTYGRALIFGGYMSPYTDVCIGVHIYSFVYKFY